MWQRGILEVGVPFSEIAMEGFLHQVQGGWTTLRVLYKLELKLSGEHSPLRAVVSLGIQSSDLEMDSLVLKSHVENNGEDLSRLCMILREIKELLTNKFSNVEVLCCPQSYNSLDHFIAVAGRLRPDEPGLLMNVSIPGVTVVVASLFASLASSMQNYAFLKQNKTTLALLS